MRLFPLSATLLGMLFGASAALAQDAATGPTEPAQAPAAPPPTMPAAPPEPSGPTTAAASQATEIAELRERLDALEQSQAEATASAEEDNQRFKIYGFLDFGLKKSFPSKDQFFNALVERKLTFLIGNINLYFDAQPTPSWRGLVEARLTTYPHGAESVDPATGQFQRQDNRIFDVNSPSGRNHVVWGGVILERAQIEHTMLDLFNLRVGYFLTPYGIWNVDHGTPTLISLVLPSFQVEESMPAHQLGVQAYGSTTVGDTELGYAAYVSNGRTPYFEDQSDNKAGGGRVYSAFSGPNHLLKLGLSGYVGDTLDRAKVLTVGADGLGVDVSTKYKYREWSLGGDVSYDWKKFRARSEGLVRRVDHGNNAHEPIALGQPGTFHPDRYEYFWYSIFAYRFGDFEPYTYTELKYVSPRDGSFNLTYLPGLGLNIYFSPYAQLKTQYVAAKFYRVGEDGQDPPHRDFRLIDSRFVLSF